MFDLAGALDTPAAGLGTVRASAQELRRGAATAAGLLAGVRALDTAATWSSPWQRRATGWGAAWSRALEADADALHRRAQWFLSAADTLEAARARGHDAADRALALPRLTPGWDLVPTRDLRAVGASLVGVAARGPVGAAAPGGVLVDGDLGGGGPVSFDPALLAALVARLREAAVTASSAVAATGRADESACLALLAAATALGGGAARAAAVAAGAYPARRLAVAGLAGTADALRLGACAVAQGAPLLAAAIDRRVAHFTAAQDLAAVGFDLDRSAWFDDAPPPTAAGLRRAGAELAALVGTDPARLTADAVGAVMRRLSALTPAEREAAVALLRGAPLEVLAGGIARLTAGRSTRTPVRDEAVGAVADLLLASAPAAMLPEVVALFPGLEPAPAGGAPRRGAGARPSDPLVRDGLTTGDVGQGALDDCYLAAALVAVVRQDPALLAGALRENPNGTVTVTLHRAGAPVEVAVTRDLPGLAATDATGRVAPPGEREDPAGMAAYDVAGHPELWAAVFEKAVARLRGGYGAIAAGGDPGAALTELTGWPHRNLAPGAVTARDLADGLAAGQAIVLGTKDRLPGGAAPGLVPDHCYALLAVDGTGDRVLLRNPWENPGAESVAWYRLSDLAPALAGVSIAGPA